mgnify:CR=1 FL=1
MHLEQENTICKSPFRYKFSGGMFTFCLVLALVGTAQAQPVKELPAVETFEPAASYCLSESCLPNLLSAKDEPEIQLSTSKKKPLQRLELQNITTSWHNSITARRSFLKPLNFLLKQLKVDMWGHRAFWDVATIKATV